MVNVYDSTDEQEEPVVPLDYEFLEKEIPLPTCAPGTYAGPYYEAWKDPDYDPMKYAN